MTIYRVWLTSLVLIAQSPAPFNQRPTDVTVIMSTSRGKYDGTYKTIQISKVCGEVPKELNFAGVPVFIVQFPDDGDAEVQDVSFDSKELIGKTTTTTRFFLSVSLTSPAIGHPNKYVLDTSAPKMRGTASITTPAPGTTRLKVDGVNDLGETVDLTVTCRPRPGQ